MRLLGQHLPTPAEQVGKVALSAHLSVDILLRGRGGEGEVRQLVYAINLSLILCEMGYGVEQLAVILAAQTALGAAGALMCDAGQWKLALNASTAVFQAIEIHEQQIELASEHDLARADLELKSRATNGHVTQIHAR